MQTPVIPDNEQQRLQALHRSGLLDTPAEERFDRLTRVARQLFDVPIALVSLVDAERQWFKSRQGLEPCETQRDISFCGHAILCPDILEIGDATEDARFSDNPLVTGAPHIRFYAGAPLIVDGQGIGTLCIIDTRPRRLAAGQRNALRDLADAVVSEITLINQYQQNLELTASRKLGRVITRAQSGFIRDEDGTGSFDRLLTDILELTGSEYGFIGEVLISGEGAPCFKTYAITNIAWSDDTQAFYAPNAPQGMALTNLNTLFGKALTTGKPVMSNDPLNDPRSGGLPEGHPTLNAFLGIPIRHGAQVVAMVGVANRSGGYDEALIDFLSPLMTTIGQLVMAVQAQQRHHRDQAELARLSRVANQTTNGVIITDVAGRVEWVNEGFTRITGYTMDEMRGQKPGDLLQGDETDLATVGAMRKALSRREAFEVDLVNYTKYGQPYWIHISCNPLCDPSGVVQGFMAIESDITATKEAEEALQASEERLRGLFELSPIGIALNDYKTGAFIDLNQALVRPTGYTREEFIGLSYWDLTPREYEAQEAQQLEGMEKTGRYGPYEKEYIRKDGSRYPVLLNGMVVYDNTGRKLIWSMIEDISERKHVEQMKNEFISTVSHELRTPVTSISGALSLVVGGVAGDIPMSMREMLTIAHKNSERLGVLINDLLDMEKLVAGKVEFDLRAQALRPLLEQAVEVNQAYADRFGVRLRLVHSTEDPLVQVDAQRLQQILANLLSNAAKFSPEGGEVKIQTTIRHNRVRVSVIDQGPGIPEAFRKRIFQKFSQADASDSRQQGGSGLGLAITRELVECMGGIVGFDSVPDQGASFWFEFGTTGTESPL